jgi:hypothetical protein
MARKRAGLHILAALGLIALHRDQGKRIVCDLDLGELPRILFPVYLALWGRPIVLKLGPAHLEVCLDGLPEKLRLSKIIEAIPQRDS